MAKRFADTKLSREPWFRKLKPKFKCAVRFIFDECDSSGVWVIDMETLSYFVGEEVTLEELLDKVNADKNDRIEKHGRDKIFIPGFCSFQYGTLTETCKPHRPIIALLKKHGLFERVLKGYRKGIDTLEDMDMDKEKEKDKGGVGEKLPALTFPHGSTEFLSLWQKWVEYRKEIKKPYQSFSSQQFELQNLGRYPEPVAIEMIKKTLKNEWKNIRPLDQDEEKNLTAPTAVKKRHQF